MPGKSTKAVKDLSGNTAGKLTCKWTKADDDVLIATLIDERNKHPGTHNGWKLSSWNVVAKALEGSELATLSKAKCVNACKQRYNKLKQQYGQVQFLRNLSGAGWNEEKQLVVMSDDIWEPFMACQSKRSKELVRWRFTPFPQFDDLAPLIEGSIATGFLASDTVNPQQATTASGSSGPVAGTQAKQSQSDRFPQESSSSRATGSRSVRRKLSLTASELALDSDSTSENADQVPDRHQDSQAIASTSSQPYRKVPRVNKGKAKAKDSEDLLSKIDALSQSLVELDTPAPVLGRPPLSILTQALQALQEVDIEISLMMLAINFFRLDPTAAETFLALSENNRVVWLNSALVAPNHIY